MEIISILQQEPIIYLSLMTVFGLFVGSFLNVLILRWPPRLKQEWRLQCHEFLETKPKKSDQAPLPGLFLPNSFCPQCNSPLRWRDNIPILSFICLLGRCHACSKHIGLRYPIIEFLTAALTVFTAHHFGFTWACAFALLFIWSLIAASVIDLDNTFIPDELNLGLMWLGLLVNMNGLFVPITDAVLGAAIGYMSLWAVYHGYRLATGKEGMGYGDFKLQAMIGAWLGWQMIPQIILISAMTGAIVGSIYLLTANKDRTTQIPFGPYIAFAAILALFYGQEINTAYFQWVGVRL